MNTELTEIRDAQKASWEKFSPGWKKWDEITMNFLVPYGDEIIRLLKPEGSDKVLDIAAGTGEPGLSIAPMIPEGKVIVTDLSEGMLDVANEKASALGLNNLETQVADACELPFENNTFDGVSCRFGLMFVPDMQLAVQEMARVVKPGGRIATTVWAGPENNFWITCMMQNISQHIDMPKPPEGAPGMFRCAQPGLIASMFEHAGLKNISENEASGNMEAGSAQQYWDFMTEVAAPFVAALSEADEETVEKVRLGVIQSMDERYPDSIIDTRGIVVGGEG